jgi:hypothetical protein
MKDKHKDKVEEEVNGNCYWRVAVTKTYLFSSNYGHDHAVDLAMNFGTMEEINSDVCLDCEAVLISEEDASSLTSCYDEDYAKVYLKS